MSDGQDIFDNEVDEAPQTTEGVSPEAPTDGPTRDEQGRFAARDKGEDGAPPAPVEKHSPNIPITALLDERDKRQRLEAELAHLRQQMQPQRQTLPDPVEDAEGYARTLHGTFQQQLQSAMLRQSEFLAIRDYGQEAVAEAMQFFDQRPRQVSEQFLQAPSPFHAAVDWYKQQKELASIGNPADYRAKIEAEVRAKLEAELAQQPPQSTRIPRSLASVGGSGNQPPPTGGHPLFD